jgi:hypothetical protein
MASTTSTSVPSYEDHIKDLQTWLTNTSNTVAATGLRDWCLLGLKQQPTATNVYAYFDNSVPNTTFQTEYDLVNGVNGQGGKFTNTPIMYTQAESDALDGLSKMFIYRYQPRLKNYRDDLENKSVRTYSSLSLALAKYALLQNVHQT